MMFAFCLMAFTGLVYYVLCLYENKRRDRKYGLPHDQVQTGMDIEKEDKTDIQNHNFRYTY